MAAKFHFKVVVIALFIALFCIPLNIATAEGMTDKCFPEGTIEVPMGTEIHIDDDNDIITIVDNPVLIEKGDTFVVYLQDLPIGYVAKDVAVHEGITVISTEKADKSVYSLLEEEGIVELTPAMYEFIPAPNVTARGYTIGGDSLNYTDGKLTMTVDLGDCHAQAYLSDLRLAHSASDGNIAITLSGNWGIETHLSTSEDILEDVPLGDIRIYGIGKVSIKLSLTQSMDVSCNLSGKFSAGITANADGSGEAVKSFSVDQKSVSGGGKISASLKLTAGVDVLIAEADIYVAIGVTTEYRSENHYDAETKITTHCDDYTIFMYSNVGAEAVCYFPAAGGKIPLASGNVNLNGEEQKPITLNIHFENGALTYGCSQGMKTLERNYGGLTANFGSSLLTGHRSRILETSVNLPWDMSIDGDYMIANGNLNLNGHTLTINGNLIQSGGTLTIGSGTLIVKGDYRIQGITSSEGSSTMYGNSTGTLSMTSANGSISIDGDFVVQTSSTSNRLMAGTINVNGDFYQNNTSGNSANFSSGNNLILNMSAGQDHIIRFENVNDNIIGCLILYNDTVVQSGMRVGRMVLSGHALSVDGDLTCTGNIDLMEGELSVTGTLYHYSGTMLISGGTLNVGGDYYIVGSNSVFEKGKESYTTGYGKLNMTNAMDEVYVGGSFVTKSEYEHTACLTAGNMYVGGDFMQFNGLYVHPNTGQSHLIYSNFAPSESHKTVLNGSNEQTISFESSSSGFGTLSATNDCLVFRNNVSWKKQESGIHAVSIGAALSSYSIDMNGYPLTIDGDVRIHSSIAINQGKLTISATAYHHAGTINLGGGSLEIGGNYYCVGSDSVMEEDADNIMRSHGYILMQNEADDMRVEGDVVIRSAEANNQFTAGTLYIGGDFRQINGKYIHPNTGQSYIVYNNFVPSAEHTTVLNGSGEQVISFESGSSGFGALEVTNEQLVFKNCVSWLVQESDIHAESTGAVLTNRSIDMNGHGLMIDGDIRMNCGVNVNEGKLTVNGSLHQSDGTLDVNSGSVEIAGHYRIVGSNSVFEEGNERYSGSNGSLKMISEYDDVSVGGSFVTYSLKDHGSLLTAGTLSIGGDFRQLGTEYDSYRGNCGRDNFEAQAGHTTVLNGTGKQEIHFQSSYSRFGTLCLNKPISSYTFSRKTCWLQLIAPDIPALILPQELTAIEDEAFMNNLSLIIVKIRGTNLTAIGNKAFKGCVNLLRIEIPATVTSIAADAFEDCENVVVICEEGSFAQQYADEQGITWKVE